MNTTHWIVIGVIALSVAAGSWYALSSHNEAMMEDTNAMHSDAMMTNDSPTTTDAMMHEGTSTDAMMSSSTDTMMH